MVNKMLRNHRLIHPVTGRSVLLPLDHGTTMGPLNGIRNIPEIVAMAVRSRVQGVIAHKGAIAWAVKGGGEALRTEYILHLSASTNMGPDESRKEIVAGVRHALQLGVTGISVHVNLGVAGEPAMLRDLGRISDEAYTWGLPVLAMMNVHKELEVSRSAAIGKRVAHAVRIAGELGADMVKVEYPGSFETFVDAAGSFSIPVLLAGGEKSSNKLEWFTSIHQALLAGCKGICIGRNIFADERPDVMCQALVGMVHEGMTPEEAYHQYNEDRFALANLI